MNDVRDYSPQGKSHLGSRSQDDRLYSFAIRTGYIREGPGYQLLYLYFSLLLFLYAASASARVGTMLLSVQAVRNQTKAAILLKTEVCCNPKFPDTAVSAERPSDILSFCTKYIVSEQGEHLLTMEHTTIRTTILALTPQRTYKDLPNR
jgi:hypothetical protein